MAMAKVDTPGLKAELDGAERALHACQLLLEDATMDVSRLVNLKATDEIGKTQADDDITLSLDAAKARKVEFENLLHSFGSERRRIEEEIRKAGGSVS
jgi:hypothetical protein